VPLTQVLVKELNATVEFENLLADAAEIDYPVAISGPSGLDAQNI